MLISNGTKDSSIMMQIDVMICPKNVSTNALSYPASETITISDSMKASKWNM